MTNTESSGSPPRRAPPCVPAFTSPPIRSFLSSSAPLEPSPVPDFASSPVRSTVTRSESFSSQQVQELTVDDIEDFEDDEDFDEASSFRVSRRNISDAAELVPSLPPFATGKMVINMKVWLFSVAKLLDGTSH